MSLTKVSNPMINGGINSIVDFGATPVLADNKTAIDTTLAQTGGVGTLPIGTFASTALTLPTGSTLKGAGASTSLAALVTVGSGATLKDMTVSGTGGIPIRITPGAGNVVVSNVNVNTTQYSTTFDLDGTDGLTIKDSNLVSTGYALLTNNYGLTTPSSSHRIRIQNNYLSSADADAIELNNPAANVVGNIVTGNFLETTSSSTAQSAGFAFGNANAQNWVFSNNVILNSRLEAIHIEDSQRGGTVVANSVNTRAHGFLSYTPVSGADSGAIPIIGNNFWTPAKVTVPGGIANSGIFLSYSSPYSPINGMQLVGNIIEGFTNGIHLRPSLTAVPNIVQCNNNTLKNNTNPLYCTGGLAKNRQFGQNYVSGSTHLAYADSSWSVGKITSPETPTGIFITAGGYGASMPPCIDGFSYPIASFTTGAGIASSIPLFTSGANNRFFGRVRYEGRRSGIDDWVFASANVLWDGATCTVTNLIYRSNSIGAGTITAITFATSAGNLIFTITTQNATQYTYGWCEFDGEYYDA